MISHEIKTPITVVKGALSVLCEVGLDEQEARELLQDALSYTDILNNIVDNLLELSRQQSGRLVLNIKAVNIADIARGILDKARSRSPIHKLEIDILSDAVLVKGDPVRIELILSNLVSNAIKYSPNGGTIVTTIGLDGDSVLTSVKDEGIGISTEDQARLFRSFERLDSQSREGIKGIGLGLRVCQILVESQGGNIWLKSAPNQGSTFYFTLPLAQNNGAV